jgi:hypothetical protein
MTKQPTPNDIEQLEKAKSKRIRKNERRLFIRMRGGF